MCTRVDVFINFKLVLVLSAVPTLQSRVCVQGQLHLISKYNSTVLLAQALWVTVTSLIGVGSCSVDEFLKGISCRKTVS